MFRAETIVRVRALTISKESRGRALSRAVLWVVWDPIGVNDVPLAYSEYDRYLAGIAQRLRNGDSAERLGEYLLTLGRDVMGMSPSSTFNHEAAVSVLRWYLAETRDQER
jgi:hypothetical protein